MMIASCGSSIKPIEHILRQASPEQLLLFTYKSTETTEILEDLSKILNNCKIFIETIEIPKNPVSNCLLTSAALINSHELMLSTFNDLE